MSTEFVVPAVIWNMLIASTFLESTVSSSNLYLCSGYLKELIRYFRCLLQCSHHLMFFLCEYTLLHIFHLEDFERKLPY
jgi:hypothetical protein